MGKIYNRDEFDKFFSKINNNENFALFRFGDGERAIMMGRKVVAQEGWQSPEHMTKLGQALLDTLQAEEDQVYLGISCPCCDREAYYWYCSRIKNKKNITFANLFVNANFARFKTAFESIKRDAIVICNHRGVGKKIGNLNVFKYYAVSDSCQDFWENDAQTLIETIKKEYGDRDNLFYAVSAGPLSEPIIYELFKNNKNNTYVDFGSSIDFFVHGVDTRPYANPKTSYAKQECWMFDPSTTCFDVSVVLTSYKKPDSLKKQIEAIEKQSLKPKELWLFKDGIAEDYTIEFRDSILSHFDKIIINDKNVGVWERFREAQKVNSTYLCIFDDDSIPGPNWLENCHCHMMEQEGVYGTIGILVGKDKQYPGPRGDMRVGWACPYNKTVEVDFVGHSWFFKREWLKFMFDNTEKYQDFKYAAEDMCLSFKCQQNGIKTFVPPHPYSRKNEWGSMPDTAKSFGFASVAISMNSAGMQRMSKAFNEFCNDGWSLCVDRNKALVYKENRKIRRYSKIRYVVHILRKIKAKILGSGK